MMLLIFLIISLVTSQNVPCNKLVPGLSYLSLGYDITTVDLNKQPLVSRQPVIEFTCNKNLTFLNPYDGNIYNVPDQLSGPVISIYSSNTDIVAVLKDNTFELEEYMNMQMTTNVDYLIGSYSHSTSVDQSINIYAYNDQTFGFASSQISVLRAYLLPGNLLKRSTALNNFISMYLTPVPVFDVKSVGTYNNMIAQTGTHWTITVDSGGYCLLKAFSDKALYASMTDVYMETQQSNELFNIILTNGGTTGSLKTVDTKWFSATVIDMEWLGGTVSPTFNYSAWANSVVQNPCPLSFELHSQSELFSDIPGLSGNFTLAVANYAAISLMKNEMLPSLNAFLVLLSKVVVTGICQVTAVCTPYPTDAACRTYYCPGPCNPSIYCGSGLVSCCTSQVIVNNFYNQANALISVAKNFTTQCNNLINQINVALQDTVVDVKQVNDIYNQFLPIMQTLETQLVKTSCTVNYYYESYGCYKYDNIQPNYCVAHNSSNVAISCPYNSGPVNSAYIVYPQGLLNYINVTEGVCEIESRSAIISYETINVNGTNKVIEVATSKLF